MHQYPLGGQRSPYFVVSFLLHLLLVFMCYQLISYHKDTQNAATNPLDVLKQLQNQERAEMKAAQSVFGAPVVFQDMPEFTPMESAEDDVDDDGSPEQVEVPGKESLMPTALQEGQTETLPEIDQDAPIAQEENNGASDALPLEPTQAATPIQVAIEKKQTIKKKEELAQQITATPKITRPSLQRRIRRNRGEAQTAAAPVNKKFTFADLAHGFLENLKNGGADPINQKGNPNKRPTYENLKYASYYQKMAWQLQAAFKRAHGARFMQPAPERSLFTCTLFLGKDGNLQNVQVLSATGHMELDAYIMAAIKDAFPLPPIPEHWQKESHQMTWNFSNIHPQSHTYHVTF